PRTPGFRLLHQGAQPEIDYGENDRVRRTIPAENIARFPLTSHASFEELTEVADALPRRTLVLTHGDAASLDNLQGHVEAHYRQQDRAVAVHAPNLGEQVLFGHVTPPSEWDAADQVPVAPREGLAPGRRYDWRSGFTIRGLTADGSYHWALLPI